MIALESFTHRVRRRGKLQTVAGYRQGPHSKADGSAIPSFATANSDRQSRQRRRPSFSTVPMTENASPSRRLHIPKVLRRLAWIITALGIGIIGISALLWYRPANAVVISTLISDRGARTDIGVAYGQGPRQTLDVYRPPADITENDAIILFLYGGSWTSGSKELYGFAGQALAARGFTTVIPDYRLYPDVQFPSFVEDVAAAYAWTDRTLARTCGARPIIIAGHSAGGHMAALLALDRKYIAAQPAEVAPPAAVIGLAGPYTFEPTVWPSTKAAFASVATTPDVPRPITYVRPGAPPFLLVHGLADDLVNLKNTRELAAALTAVGTSVEVQTYENIGHIGLVLSLSRPLRWRAPALDRMVAFASKFARTPAQLAECRKP